MNNHCKDIDYIKTKDGENGVNRHINNLKHCSREEGFSNGFFIGVIVGGFVAVTILRLFF